MIADRKLTLEGKDVFYRTIESPGAGRNILLLHGMSFTSMDWEQHDLMQEFSRMGYNVYAVDYPGFGKSMESQKYSIEEMDNENCASFVKDFCNASGINLDCIVGPSMGGYIALAAVSVFPEISKKAVVIGPGGETRLEGVLDRVQAEVLIIWGTEDSVIPPETGKKFLKLIKKGKLVNVEKAGHAAYLDRPAEFLDIVRQFLGKD